SRRARPRPDAARRTGRAGAPWAVSPGLDPLYTGSMTVLPDVETAGEPAAAARDILRRYFYALGAPFAIDVATVAVYAWVNGVFDILGPMVLMSAIFLLAGVWGGGWFLIRPVRRFL